MPTSARLRSIKASRELIHELATSDKHPAPLVPTRKVTFSLEGVTLPANGWNIPGGWVEGMGLFWATTCQVFKVCSNPLKKGERGTAGALTRVVRLQPEILMSTIEGARSFPSTDRLVYSYFILNPSCKVFQPLIPSKDCWRWTANID